MAATPRDAIAENLAKPPEVAAALGITENALNQMRYRGTGPAYTRVGYRVRYRWSDIEKYLAAQTVTPTA
jgi:predicted DNA-binding transcriptional regulator AlpA